MIQDAQNARAQGDEFLRASLATKRDFIKRSARRHGLRVTSDYRPGDPGFHGKNRAIDVAGPAAAMARFFDAFVPLARGKGVRELFYDPRGGWDNGRSIGAIGGHSDHVHIAFDPPP